MYIYSFKKNLLIKSKEIKDRRGKERSRLLTGICMVAMKTATKSIHPTNTSVMC